MKKVICILSIFVMIFGCALAEIDLSGMSFDELADLRDKALLAMWKTDEWQEVTVPQGVYEIGKEIPAGKWTLRCDTNSVYGNSHIYIYEDMYIINNPASKYFSEGSLTEYTFDLEEGAYFEVSSVGCPVVFTPFTGVNFSFK